MAKDTVKAINRVEEEEDDEKTFEQLGLEPRLVHALTKKCIEKPTPIQRVAIPLILEGKDVVARAKTGSGKTFAYLLPLLHKLMASDSGSKNRLAPSAFVLVPTRELCQQGIAVVALLRHFGCFCSWEIATILKEAKPKFESAGVKLIVVGVGTSDKARILADGLPFPMDCLYADPNRKAYEVLDLYYGFGRTFFNPINAKMLWRIGALKKSMENYTLAATPDDRSGVLQQGGMFVFKGKQLLYARKDEGPGDHAPIDEVFDICNKMQAA